MGGLRNLAEVINLFRVFPRLFAVYYMWGMAQMLNWAKDLPAISAEQASMVIAVITGAAAYFKFYVDTGGKTENT